MRKLKTVLNILFAASLFVSSAFAGDKTFNTEKILADLQSKLKLTTEKISHLKPVIDTKSVELKKSLYESVDSGFVQLDKLSEKMDSLTRDIEKKAGEILDSEQMGKLKEYLKKLDEKALERMMDRTVAELSAILELSKAQMVEIKPILEDSYTQLSEFLITLTQQGNRRLERLRQWYDRFTRELKEKLEGILDSRQMEKLEKYNEEQKEEIERDMYSVDQQSARVAAIPHGYLLSSGKKRGLSVTAEEAAPWQRAAAIHQPTMVSV